MGIRTTENAICADEKADIARDIPKLKDWSKGDQLFQGFWEECKSLTAREPVQMTALDSQLADYKNQIVEITSVIARFRNFLRVIPMIVAIGYWVKGLVTDEFWSERYLPNMLKLQRSGVIPLRDSEGNLIPLDYLMQRGHQEILENIRCVNEWSLFEKEEIVQCYVQFSHSLARQTLGIVSHGFDPDRDRVRSKAIRYESFIDFAQHLSERDSLIAKLLYFGAPSLDEVLSLRGKQISTNDFSIQFDRNSVVFPRHLIHDLVAFQEANSRTKKLVFSNVKGAEVERAHLNQSFARACERMSKKAKITPGSLLKMESESIGSFL